MLKRSFVPYAVALACGLGLTMGVQATSQESGRPDGEAQPAGTMVHVEGCVYPEAALSSSMPVVVPPGSAQPFFLMDVKVISGDITAEKAAKTTYTLKADTEELRRLYGKRAGVTGRVDLASSAAKPELSVVNLREISGGCPTLPPH